jgi:hypothetical protein
MNVFGPTFPLQAPRPDQPHQDVPLQLPNRPIHRLPSGRLPHPMDLLLDQTPRRNQLPPSP